MSYEKKCESSSYKKFTCKKEVEYECVCKKKKHKKECCKKHYKKCCDPWAKILF